MRYFLHVKRMHGPPGNRCMSMHYNLNQTAGLEWMKNIYMGVDAYLLYFDDLCKNIFAQCKWFPRPLCNVLSKKVIHYKAGDYVGLHIFLMDENVIAMDSVAWRFPIWLVPTYLAMGIIRCVGTILDSKSGNNMICKTSCQKWQWPKYIYSCMSIDHAHVKVRKWTLRCVCSWPSTCRAIGAENIFTKLSTILQGFIAL